MSDGQFKTEKSPAELWATMTQTPRPFKIVDFPRCIDDMSIKVGIRVLTQDEQMRVIMLASTEAKKELVKNKIDYDSAQDIVRQVVEYHNTMHLVYEVCRDPEDQTKPFFRSVAEIRKELSSDEVAALANEWLVFTSEASPLVTKMSKVEMESMIEFIAAEGASLPLARMTPVAVIHLLNFMASRLSTLPTASE